MPTAVLATLPFMPSILLDLSAKQKLPDIKDRLELWIYRISAYLLINVIDDPAWLALMFC